MISGKIPTLSYFHSYNRLLQYTHMLTKEDIQLIIQPIEALIKAEGAEIRKDMVTKEDLRLNNAVFSTIIKVELGETRAELGKKIDKVQDTLDDKAEERYKQLEARIEALEKQLRNPKPARD